MKVRIDAGGREVEIETSDANMSPKDLADKALEVWQATGGAKTSEGPAYGFAQERRGWQVSPMNMGMGGRGGGFVNDPKAVQE